MKTTNAEATLLAVGSAPTPANSDAYSQSWKRVLEKQFFERRQAAIAKETQSEKPVSDGQVLNNANATGQSDFTVAVPPTTMEHNIEGHLVSAMNTRPSPSTSLLPLQTLMQGNAQHPLALGSAYHSVAVNASLKSQQASPLTRDLPAILKGSLPESASVNLLNTAGGMQLVIRDSGLAAQDLLSSLRKILQMLAKDFADLHSVILNGEEIWSRAVSDLSLSQEQHFINQVY